MSRNRKRKQRSTAEKMRIVLAGMESRVEVSELCRREGINPTQYYNWKSQLMKSAEAVFSSRASKSEQREEERRAQELRRMQAVIAKITAENLELKKRSWTDRPRPIASGTSAVGRGGS